MENHMEKQMENDMVSGILFWFTRFRVFQEGSFLGVPTRRSIVCGDLDWVPPTDGNYHLSPKL